jgi:hypothetical protein
VVERQDGAYRLTPAGEDLQVLVMQLAEWGSRHAFGAPREEELDPDLLMWWMHTRIDAAELGRRAVVEIHMTDIRRRYWLVVEHDDVSVCHTDPGFEVDVVLRGELTTLYRVWLGHVDLRESVRRGELDLLGSPKLVRALPDWLQLSQVAPIVREAQPVGAR